MRINDQLVIEKTGKTDTKDLMWAYEKDQIVLKTVHELLECPVCLTIKFPPIYQCRNGHTLCSICKIQVKSRCPICRIAMSSIRCLALEKIAKPLEVPYECPYDGRHPCSITGNIPELVTHLKNDHDANMYDGTIFKHSYVQSRPLNEAKWKLNVINCYGRQFCLHFQSFTMGTGLCYIACLQFMGEDLEAKNFGYVLEVYGNDRKFAYEGVPRSIRDGYRKIVDELDGPLIPPIFWAENEQQPKLQIKATIFAKL